MRRYKATIFLAAIVLIAGGLLTWRITSCEHVNDGTRYGSWKDCS